MKSSKIPLGKIAFWFTHSSFLQNDDSARDVTTYTVLILEKSSVQINQLTPDTTYMFRVQALGHDGNPGSYSKEYEFRTSPLGTSGLQIKNKHEWKYVNISSNDVLFDKLELINVLLLICTAEYQIQNKSTMAMVAVFGVVVILLVVVAVLLLRRRLVPR